MMIQWRHLVCFLILNNILNLIGWGIQIHNESSTHITFPTTISDVLGMMLLNSMFQILIFIRFGKFKMIYPYLFVVIFLPRFLCYICGGDCNEMMEILNSFNGLNPVWIEPLYQRQASEYYMLFNVVSIERYVLYLIAISAQILLVHELSKVVANLKVREILSFRSK